MKYIVGYRVMNSYEINIEADSIEEAKETFLKRWSSGEEVIDESTFCGETLDKIVFVYDNKTHWC